MSASLDVQTETVVHLRTAIMTFYGSVSETSENIKTSQYTAIVLDINYFLLNFGHQVCKYLRFQCINGFLRSQYLLFVILKFLSDIPFSTYQCLFANPFRRHFVLEGKIGRASCRER